MWTFIKAFVEDGLVPTIPAPVIIEAWRGGRQARLSRLIHDCRVDELDELRAKRAGELCGRASSSDPVDAAVIESASRRGDVVLTSDPGDLVILAAFVSGVVIRPVAGI
ncbi:MAG: twitching motility protein PilT [Actinomycetota bacterium]|nr:twitching motility protein PilT [Actinomycetota bacterium]